MPGSELAPHPSLWRGSEVLLLPHRTVFPAGNEGDGAGIPRGLVQASAAGVVVGREIAARIGQPKGEL